MTKLQLVSSFLFIGTVFVAANFTACSSKSNGTPGTAGTTGSAGSAAGAGGTGGSVARLGRRRRTGDARARRT